MKCLRSDDAAQQPYEEVCARLQSDLKNGLDWNEVDFRLKVCGHNELEVKQEEPLWKKYLDQFKNPLIVLLLASALVSICMQQFDDAFSITAVSNVIRTLDH